MMWEYGSKIWEVWERIIGKILGSALLSLSTVVLNSRDRHEKTWRPTFTHLHNSPHNILFTKKPTEIRL